MQQVLLSHVTGHSEGGEGEVERVKEEFIDRDETAFPNIDEQICVDPET